MCYEISKEVKLDVVVFNVIWHMEKTFSLIFITLWKSKAKCKVIGTSWTNGESQTLLWQFLGFIHNTPDNIPI